MQNRILTLLALILCFNFVATAAIDTVYLEGSVSTIEAIPVGVVDFKDPDKLIPNLKEKVSASFNRDLGISGRFAPLVLAKRDSSKFVKSGIAYYLHGSIKKLSDGRLELECRLTTNQSLELVVGQSYKVKKTGLRKAIHNFSDLITWQLWGEQGSAATYLTYVSNVKGNKQIVVSDYDGFNPWRLTAGNTINTMPVWHPNSKSVFFVSFRGGTSGIYRRDLFSGKTKQIYANLGQSFAPAVSPKGDYVAFTVAKNGSSDIYKGTIDGKKSERMTYHWAVETSPSWSPKGSEILYSSDRSGGPQIYAMDAYGADQRRITYMGRYNESSAWSPNGDKIAYVSMDEGKLNIYTCNLDGSEVTQLTANSGNNENPTWSPDGRMIAFSSNRSGKSQIYIMRADGSGVTQITTRGVNSLPSWSGFITKTKGVQNESN